MTSYHLMRTYLEALFAPLLERARCDQRGATAETIVLVGVGLLGAAAVAVILWAKLRAGAENVSVPSPAAP